MTNLVSVYKIQCNVSHVCKETANKIQCYVAHACKETANT